MRIIVLHPPSKNISIPSPPLTSNPPTPPLSTAATTGSTNSNNSTNSTNSNNSLGSTSIDSLKMDLILLDINI